MSAVFSESVRVLWAKGGERLVITGDYVVAGQVLARTGEYPETVDHMSPFDGVVVHAGDGFAVVRREGVWPPVSPS